MSTGRESAYCYRFEMSRIINAIKTGVNKAIQYTACNTTELRESENMY